MNVTTLRPYRVRNIITSEFISFEPKRNQQWCEEDLTRSGLTPEDMLISFPANLKLPQYALAGYHIPYFDLSGRVLTDKDNNTTMWRERYKLPQFSKEPKYLQPSKEELAQFDLPGIIPYLLPYPKDYNNGIIYCVEGEKKTAAVIKHCKVAAFGISGCQMWRNPTGDGGIHPWILEYIRNSGAKTVRIIPDSDVLRYDMCTVYGTYADVLGRAGVIVEILHPGEKIDDTLGRHNVPADFIDTIPRLTPDQLVLSPIALAAQYGLAFRTSDKGIRTVHQHTSNVMKLMENHNAFPKFWRNTDTNRVMVGEDTAQPDLTEMEIANHFQHNFGFDKVTNRLVYSCIQALAKKNQRSPMLDYIRCLSWDGQSRLDSWLTRLWGVEDSDFTREVSAKWLVSACARMDKPGTKVDWMLIVVGPQGVGKTSMPGILFKGNSLTMYGDQNDKDLHMLLHSALVVGFDELDSFGRRESSNLKAMVTRSEDMFRPPYGASVEVFKRRFTLYGCGNRYEFLQHDPSGYRRYAVVEVNRLLDFNALASEVDQLWAEAWNRYVFGSVKFWEVENASSHAERYVAPNPLEEKIQNFIISEFRDKKGNMIKDGVLSFTMTQLLSRIGEEHSAKNPNVTREMAAILRGMGAVNVVQWVGGRSQRVWQVTE